MNPDRIPKEAPDITGPAGRGWIITFLSQPGKSGVGMWLLHRPGVHLVWDTFILSGIHLRDIPDAAPAFLQFEGATHEVMILALDPERPFSLDPLPGLHPANLAYQVRINAPTPQVGDEGLRVILREAAQAVCSGYLNPDSDGRRRFEEFLRWRAEKYHG